MKDLTIRIIGGIGALLIAIPFPKIELIINTIGLVMLVIAFYELSIAYKVPDLFKNIVVGLILQFLAIVAIIVIAGISLFTFHPPAMATGIIIAVLVGYVLFVLGGWRFKKGIDILTSYNENFFFHWAGILVLAGSILVAFFGIGILVIWVGYVLLAIAFFTMKPITLSKDKEKEVFYV